MNVITLIGTLNKAPDSRVTDSGMPFAILCVTTPNLTSRSERKSDRNNVIVRGDRAKEVRTLKKGDRVIIVGQSRTRSWTDNNG